MKIIGFRSGRGESGGSGRRSKGRHFRQSLILILVVSSIPGLIIGGLIYWLAGGRIEMELHRLHDTQMLQRITNIDQQLSYLEMSLSHWAFDTKFNEALKEKDLYRDFEETGNLTKTLRVMQGSNPLIRSVELYVDGVQPILLNPGYVGANRSVYDGYASLLKQGKPVYWTKIAPTSAASDQEDIALVHKIPGGSTEPWGVILIRLDRNNLNQLMKPLTSSADGEAYLRLKDGSIIASAGDTAAAAAFDSELEKASVRDKSGQGSFLLNLNQMTYSVSSGNLSRISSNWSYVSAAPINAITAPVVFVTKLIWTVSLAGLLLAAGLAWFASRRLYSPVARLTKLLAGERTEYEGQRGDEFKLMERQWQHLAGESIALRNKLEKQLPHVKEGFLLQLIQRYLYPYSEHDLRERMRQYGWNTDDCSFVLLYVQLAGFTDLEGRFSDGDEGLVTFAAANIVQELASTRAFQSNVINFHDLSMGLLVMVPRGEAYKSELDSLSGELIRAINGIVKVKVTIVISRPSESIRQLPSLFEEAKQAIGHRNLVHLNQIIDMEQTDSEAGSNDLFYPIALEREVIQQLRSGQLAEAVQAFEKFIQKLSGEGAKEIDVQLGLLQLLGAVQNTIMHAGINPKQLFGYANMFEQLSELREPKLMLSWFQHKIVEPYIKELEARSRNQVKTMVEQVRQYMQHHYMNNISLEQCADRTGTNPYYLSKAFKQVTGKNFIDYLTELRLDMAKELLRETELKVNTVAERVGYQHTYLNRIFKKMEGITPSQFRVLSRKPSEASLVLQREES